MNTYLVPFTNNTTCDIFKIYANSWNDCENKIMEKYVNKFDSDELADIDSFEIFCNKLDEIYGVFIGNIHELEDFE